ncbi:hypothetical protein RRG08_058764 [Elysia crispata]|uniref:Uncharacterized protein n=1 Tax=Elysia crispata TaxID=231223 RepID=A0AAE0YWC1_9GAST|nr:hypothetical protein RRG08_058764 [Elysia crispata]
MFYTKICGRLTGQVSHLALISKSLVRPRTEEPERNLDLTPPVAAQTAVTVRSAARALVKKFMQSLVQELFHPTTTSCKE